jgi:hypothetical protein
MSMIDNRIAPPQVTYTTVTGGAPKPITAIPVAVAAAQLR